MSGMQSGGRELLSFWSFFGRRSRSTRHSWRELHVHQSLDALHPSRLPPTAPANHRARQTPHECSTGTCCCSQKLRLRFRAPDNALHPRGGVMASTARAADLGMLVRCAPGDRLPAIQVRRAMTRPRCRRTAIASARIIAALLGVQ